MFKKTILLLFFTVCTVCFLTAWEFSGKIPGNANNEYNANNQEIEKYKPEISLSVSVKSESYGVLRRQPLEFFSYGLKTDFRFGIVSTSAELLYGKDSSGTEGVMFNAKAGIEVSAGNFRFCFRDSLNFPAKKLYGEFELKYAAKNGMTFGTCLVFPTDFSFDNPCVYELNNLKRIIPRATLGLSGGYTFNRQQKKPWCAEISQSLLYTEIGFSTPLNGSENTVFRYSVGLPLLSGKLSYSKDYDYPYQCTYAMFYTSIKYSASCMKRIAGNFFLGAGLTSLGLDGSFVDIPARFQAYSITLNASVGFNLGKNSTLAISTGVPVMTAYFLPDSNCPVMRTVFNDNNAITALKYMTKVSYAYKFN